MISFTAKDLKDQNDLGPATYIALAIATSTYVAISLGVFGQLTPEQVTAAGPTAIALAARRRKPVLGQVGLRDRGDHGDAVHRGRRQRDLYPAPGLLGIAGRAGHLPAVLRHQEGAVPGEPAADRAADHSCSCGSFDLSAIASLGSAVALLIFLMISIGHFKIRKETGANCDRCSPWACLTVVITLLGFFATTLKTSPASLVAFVALVVLAVIADAIWRSVRGKRESATSATEATRP